MALREDEANPNIIIEQPNGNSSPSNVMLGWDKLPCSRNCFRDGTFTKDCGIRHLKRRLPIIKWVPTITLSSFLYDLAGGLTVGLTAIPQSLAYAQLASMPLENGLYTTIISGFAYFLLGTAKDVNLGPTSLVSLLTGGIVDDVGAYVHSILCFFTGLIMIAFAFLRLEILLNIFPITVTSGFTSAAAILIIASQLKYFFGIPKLPRAFIDLVPEFFNKLYQTNYWDFVGGALVLAFLLGVQYTVPVFMGLLKKRKQTRCIRVASTSLLVFNTLRAITAIVISSGIAYAIHQAPYCPMAQNNQTNQSMPMNCTKSQLITPLGLTLTGPVPRGLPRPEAPPFNGMFIKHKSSTSTTISSPAFKNDSIGNSSFTTTAKPDLEFVSFEGLLAKINIGLIIIPLISTIELLAIGRAMAQKNGYSLDASQEMMACGCAHFAGAFLNAYPSSASITRSALNSQCDVKTQLCSAFTALLVLIAASTIADSCLPYVPKACLAAVVIAAALSMIETHMAKMTWRVNRVDILPTVITFIACLLLDIEYGILVGVVASLIISAILSMRSVRAKTVVKERKLAPISNHNCLVVTMPQGELRYPCADSLKKMWSKTSGHVGPVAIDCSEVREVDFATIIAILQLAKSPPKAGAIAGTYPLCMVGLDGDLLPKFKNAINVLHIRPPSHRAVHFADTLLETVGVCDGADQTPQTPNATPPQNSENTPENTAINIEQAQGQEGGDIEMGQMTGQSQTPIAQSRAHLVPNSPGQKKSGKRNRRRSM